MADKLIIVESPAKANTIKKFLGGSTKVTASQGHIRDLPKSKLGVEVDEGTFEPQYINIRGKGDLIKKLKADAKSAKKVYLATDPDREGEAIAWHLAHILGIDTRDICRVTFNEITKGAVQAAIKNPSTINLSLVDAQQARRVLDRIVGYKISPLLWKKVRKGLSAGRVQSVAVKVIVDREEEIENFKSQEYWNIYADLTKSKEKKIFTAKFIGKNGKKQEINSEKDVKKIVKEIDGAEFTVKNVKNAERKKNPAPPFITSTMQQEASKRLGFTLKKTMSVAQMLYESGKITYMRTDSTRISEEARAAAKTQVTSMFGHDYYENRYYKAKKDSQDAHEAIRPSYINEQPKDLKDSLNNDQYKLYKLIYERFLASQMSAAIYDTTAVDINAKHYLFRANGSVIKFKGYMALYLTSEDTEEEKQTAIPKVTEGEVLDLKELKKVQSFTEPPPRYTEASLVKELEDKGIGRPSTYAPTITTILDRRYIEKEKKTLFPTELGKVVNSLLVENFKDIVNVEFTATMEGQFDKVEEGQIKWKEIISKFYGPFNKNLLEVEEKIGHVELEEEVSDIPCEKCGKMMIYKYGRYGKFLACPGFPECKNAKPIVQTIKEPCPKCGGAIIVKKTKKRRNFYVCENNPGSCEYIAWNPPKYDKHGKYMEEPEKKEKNVGAASSRPQKKAPTKKTAAKATTKKKTK